LTNDDTSSSSLTGVWHGRYSYPYAQDSVSFVATIFDGGDSISGRTHEVCGFGPSTGDTIFATLTGARRGNFVNFTKVYENVRFYETAVSYEGTLDEDSTEISGSWTVPGHWSGTFLMIRAGNLEIARTVRAFEKV
jgi:hypothetical protein